MSETTASASTTAGSKLSTVFSRRNALLAVGGAVGAGALTKVGSASARSLASTSLVTGPSASSNNQIVPAGSKSVAAADVIGLSIKAVSGQTSDLTQWFDATGRVVASVNTKGGIMMRGATHILGKSTAGVANTSPVVNFKNRDGANAEVYKWTVGPERDTINNLPNNDFVIKRIFSSGATANVVHLHEVTTWRTTMSFNWSPPPLASVAVSGPDNSTAVPTMVIRKGANQTGEILRVIASSGAITASIGADSSLNVPGITIGELKPAGTGPMSMPSIRVASPDAANPAGLFLNARATNSGPDIKLRNLESSFYGSHFMQVTNSDSSRAYLTIRQDSGYVGIGNIMDMLAPLDIDGNTIRVRQSQTPASSSAGGYVGTITWDAQYVYVCVAPNTWKRTALVPA